METQNLIYKKLITIMNEVGAIGKNKTNTMQNYKFRGIDDMYNALHPLFAANGVFITSQVIESKREERQTAKGGLLIYSIIKAQFDFIAEDGSRVSSIIEGEAMDSGDKATNKALSVALKYALMQMFMIPTEEKIDTEYESPQPTMKAPELPVISETQFQKAKDRIEAGEKGVYEKLIELFAIPKEAKAELAALTFDARLKEQESKFTKKQTA